MMGVDQVSRTSEGCRSWPLGSVRRRPATASLKARRGARDIGSVEEHASQNLELKRTMNELKQQTVQAQSLIARLEQQKADQAKQIIKLMQGTKPSMALRREHEKSLIVKKLRQHIAALRLQLSERDETISRLRNSQRNAVLLELETAKEEFFLETQRLKQQILSTQQEQQHQLHDTENDILNKQPKLSEPKKSNLHAYPEAKSEDEGLKKDKLDDDALHLLLHNSNTRHTTPTVKLTSTFTRTSTLDSTDTDFFLYSVDSTDNYLHISPESTPCSELSSNRIARMQEAPHNSLTKFSEYEKSYKSQDNNYNL